MEATLDCKDYKSLRHDRCVARRGANYIHSRYKKTSYCVYYELRKR